MKHIVTAASIVFSGGRASCPPLGLGVATTLLAATLALAADKPLKLEPGLKITANATIAPGTYVIPAKWEEPAITIAGDNITVDFAGAELVGAADDVTPDQFEGLGIAVTGTKVTLRNAKVRGYKVGIRVHDSRGSTLEKLDVGGNYQMRLKSTPQAEDGADWLWPHKNDKDEWATNYGAGLWVKNCDHMVIREVKASHGQNGIIIDRVNDSQLYDCDCSFLSGWGLAMWRANRNTISRNAFDFCVRGYSHGVYNRGQDSAGILMFEQCNSNVLAENSVTHGGDGIFGFAGREALGEEPPPAGFDHKRKGNNANLLIGNDFSYAPAHGIEMTFSFGNQIIANRLVENAICGVWGGYSQDTVIVDNEIAGNGSMAYGLERGGINIEHGAGNLFQANRFKDNRCGVHLWWDNDEGLLKGPWCQANYRGSKGNSIVGNSFEGDQIGIQLRATAETTIAANTMQNVERELVADEKSPAELKPGPAPQPRQKPKYQAFGKARPVGTRKQLAGRQHIVMTEWGPYDYSAVAVFPETVRGADEAAVQVLGPKGDFKVTGVTGDIEVSPKEGKLPGYLKLKATKPGLHRFALKIDAGGKPLEVTGTLLSARWDVKFYAWAPETDPREGDNWKTVIAAKPIDTRTVSAIDFKWGGGGLGKDLPNDRFATQASTSIELPAGRYRLWTVSDDGIRAWIGDKQLINDWAWHAPKENTAEFEHPGGPAALRIEHFEIDGMAQLQARIEPVEAKR